MELKRWSANAQVIAALVSGLLIGIGISASHNSTLVLAAASVETIGNLWINAIRMTVIPLVISLLFVSMNSFPDVRSAGRRRSSPDNLRGLAERKHGNRSADEAPYLFAGLSSAGPAATGMASSPGAASVVQQTQQLPSLAQ